MIVSIQQSTFPLDPQFVGALYSRTKKGRHLWGFDTSEKYVLYILVYKLYRHIDIYFEIWKPRPINATHNSRSSI
jgi:hypothetical protein